MIVWLRSSFILDSHSIYVSYQLSAISYQLSAISYQLMHYAHATPNSYQLWVCSHATANSLCP
ncbi:MULTISPECIES: hypothetical protein [unclassified Moorena]|uniref:hypothetical protein n=1 Tax=unclassified Moorena TaxID=2683338 RepID=UPI00096A60C9|nr:MULTISPECIES: hypothetical protein [unclassified Moorena]NEQ15666.1 hypothetical protein [Moorena sp. SIO3E2]NES44073.1 hypothetical protein [Moorena sp. SIO2C4]